MVENFLETLIAVGFGGALGFLSSIGFYLLRERLEKKDYRKRLRLEFESLRDKIKEKLEKQNFIEIPILRDYFMYHKQELVSKVDAETWEMVIKAHNLLERIRWVTEDKETKKAQYFEALQSIEDVIKKLDP